ncbi:hypothetical protein [Nocardioides sp.]|uniref:sialidase family protein n=1 Tax=Nocardioides sp. TaxID=35761 RepID=UPI00271B3CB6|nr:hypothetical protein [Nocardioides sp.]MDO9457589.1 hypothetical protein [Nocardioides sp.]
MRRFSRLLLPLVVLVVAFSGSVVPAQAAVPDVWVKWNMGDVWIRSLDYVTPTQLVGGSETDGVYTATNAVGPWTDISGNLPPAGKQVHQAVGQSGQIFLATSAGLYRGTGGGSWTRLGVDDATPQPQRLDQGGVQSVVFPTGELTNVVVATAGSGRDGVFYSSDAGKKWAQASGLTGATFYLTSAGPVMYAAATTGFYRSANAGRSWSLISDGIPPGESPKRISVSPLNPAQLIAATVGGVYRSDNAGTTWYDASGTGDGALLAGEVRAFQLVPSAYWGDGRPRIVAGTNNGVWATLDGGESWAKMSGTKLNAPGEVAMTSESAYGLNIGFGTPGSLMVGTQGHGVFSLPLSAVEAPAAITSPSGSPVKNVVLTANNGTWGGTGPFLYRYQWKRCSTSAVGSCSNISGETDRTYQLAQADVGQYVRVGVRALNIVQPAFSAEVVSSAVGPVAAPAGFEPTPPTNYPKLLDGTSAPWGTTMTIDPSDDAQERWKSNGTYTATSFEFSWSRCDLDGDPCVDIPGETGLSYTTTVEDVDHVVRGDVIGTIASTRSPRRLAGISGAVYEKKPVNTAAPRVVGPAYVGTVLQSTAGAWTGTHPSFARRWLRCNAQGLQCNPTNPVVTTSAYAVKATDKGSTFRIEITARVEDQFQPRTQVATSARSAAVGNPPPTCAQLKAAVTKAVKGVKAAQKALQKAKKTGKRKKIKAAQKKLKAAKAALAKARSRYEAGGC